ncbi:hypothetical protein GA0115245_12054 [Streptomyces sp. di188]|nr:hypothetical protein GA0115238_10603 [Streptomyces sp. di50b]SCE08081.1 hypothetical protein GA0115245_12054 [Streptomyces sp. di188]
MRSRSARRARSANGIRSPSPDPTPHARISAASSRTVSAAFATTARAVARIPGTAVAAARAAPCRGLGRPGRFGGLERPAYGVGGPRGAGLVGLLSLLGGLLERLVHGGRRRCGGPLGLLRPLAPPPRVPGALQQPAQRAGLGEYGHGGGVGIAGPLPAQPGELR